jgi:CRP-like cAMP-binding protein
MKTIADIIRKGFNAHFNVPGIQWEALAVHARLFDFQRNETIRQINTTETCINYVVSGTAGLIAIRNDKEICLELCYENNFLGDYASLLTQQPSPVETRMLETGAVLRIPFIKLLDFYKTLSPVVIERIGRLFAEQLFINKHFQHLETQLLSAEERYENLLIERPDLLEKVPFKYIASYLGITPDSFARLRKKSEVQSQ